MARGRPRTTRTSSKSQSPVKPPESKAETIVLSSGEEEPSPRKGRGKIKKTVLSPELVPSEEDADEHSAEPVPSSPVTPKTPKRGRTRSMTEVKGREYPASPSPVKRNRETTSKRKISQVSPGVPVQDDDQIQALKDARRKSAGKPQKKARFYGDDGEANHADGREEGTHDDGQEGGQDEEAKADKDKDNEDEGFELVDDQTHDSKTESAEEEGEEVCNEEEAEEVEEEEEEKRVAPSLTKTKAGKLSGPRKASSAPFKYSSLGSRGLAEAAAMVIPTVPNPTGKQPTPRPAYNRPEASVKEEETEVDFSLSKGKGKEADHREDKGKGVERSTDNTSSDNGSDDDGDFSEEEKKMLKKLKAMTKRKRVMPAIEHKDEYVKNLFKEFQDSLLRRSEPESSTLQSPPKLQDKGMPPRLPSSAFPLPDEEDVLISDQEESEAPPATNEDPDDRESPEEPKDPAEDEEDATRRNAFVTDEDETYDGELLDRTFSTRDKENLMATLPPMKQLLCNSWDGRAHDNPGCHMDDLLRSLFNARYFKFLVGYEGVGSLLNPFYASPTDVGTMQVANQTCLAIRKPGEQKILALCGCVGRVINSNLSGEATNGAVARKSCSVNFPSMFLDRMQSLFHAAWLRVHPPFRSQILHNRVELVTMIDRRGTGTASDPPTSSAPSTPRTPRRSKPVVVEHQGSKNGTSASRAGSSSTLQVSLPFSATVPVYDGRKQRMDFTSDRPYSGLPLFRGDLKTNYPVFVGFHVHSYKNKDGYEFLSFDIQWVVVLDCPPIHISRMNDP